MWYYNDTALTEIPPNVNGQSPIGFVYLIYNPQSNKKYIGKKLFYSSKTIQKNNKKRKIKVQSDWQTYNGSNQSLLQDIQNHSPALKKEILYLCYSKSQCSYLEAKEQFQRNVILNDEYYNDWISVKVTRKHLQKYAESTLC
jgi:flagellar basal body-associated protein FliL